MDITFATMHDSINLTIGRAELLAEAFFRHDPSSAHANSYDRWIQSGRSPISRIVEDDIHAINTTMAARSPLSAWQSFTSTGELAPLAAIPATWDLFDLSDEEWSQYRCAERVTDLLATVVGPYRGLAVATKVLHAKRPRLIPVLDSYVVQMIGGTGPAETAEPKSVAGAATAMIEHIREQGRANLEALLVVQQHLAWAGFDRSLVRILDALLWVSHPGAWGSWTYRKLGSVTAGISVDSGGSADGGADATVPADAAGNRDAGYAVDADLLDLAQEALFTCPLRFDGERYVEDTGFDYDTTLRRFFGTGAWPDAQEEQLAAFFLLQRAFHFGLDEDPPNSPYWRALRDLFLRVYAYEIPARYRDEEFCREWEERFVPRLAEYVGAVRAVHERMDYEGYTGDLGSDDGR